VAAHGVGGTVGALLTGVFASKALNGVFDGALYGNPGQVGIQATAVLTAIVYSGVMSFVLLPAIPPRLFGGVSRIAMETGAAVRDSWMFIGPVFAILTLAAGFGKMDRFLKFFTAASLAALAFFAVATWWAIRSSPVGSIKF